MEVYYKTINGANRYAEADAASRVDRIAPGLVFREIAEADNETTRKHVELYNGHSFIQAAWIELADLELLENFSRSFAFAEAQFIRTCVSEHWRFNDDDSIAPFYTNMDYLIALAIVQSKLDHTLEAGPNDLRKGIFGITEEEWGKFRETEYGKYYEAGDQMNPYAQISCAAYQMHADAKSLSELWRTEENVGTHEDPYIPRFGELLRCRLIGVEKTFALQKALKSGAHGTTLNVFLENQGMDTDDINELISDRADFMRAGQAASSPADSLKGFRNKVETILDKAFQEAFNLLKEHSPETVKNNSGSAPWMAIAEKELNTSETNAADHPTIAAYFEATGTNGTHLTPWCAAFVAWCMNEAGGEANESYQTFRDSAASSASWLKWGRPLNLKQPFPKGAVVLLAPSSETDEISHVGFFESFVSNTKKAKVKILGGNQSDMVTYTDFDSVDIVSAQWLDTNFSTVGLGNATDPRYAEILTLIASQESGGKYNAHFGNADNTDPLFTGMSITEVRTWQDQFVGGGSPSSAVGKYQIIRKTLDGLIKSMKLDGSEIFDANIQDKMAMKLMLGRGLRSFLSGSMSRTEFGNNLAKEWASFPVLSSIRGAHVSVSRGNSYYSGDNLNAAHIDPAAVEQALDNLLA